MNKSLLFLLLILISSCSKNENTDSNNTTNSSVDTSANVTTNVGSTKDPNSSTNSENNSTAKLKKVVIVSKISKSDQGIITEKIINTYDNFGNLKEIDIYKPAGAATLQLYSTENPTYDTFGNIKETIKNYPDVNIKVKTTNTYNLQNNLTQTDYFKFNNDLSVFEKVTSVKFEMTESSSYFQIKTITSSMNNSLKEQEINIYDNTTRLKLNTVYIDSTDNITLRTKYSYNNENKLILITNEYASGSIDKTEIIYSGNSKVENQYDTQNKLLNATTTLFDSKGNISNIQYAEADVAGKLLLKWTQDFAYSEIEYTK